MMTMEELADAQEVLEDAVIQVSKQVSRKKELHDLIPQIVHLVAGVGLSRQLLNEYRW